MVSYVVSGAIIVDNIIPYGETKPVAVQLGGGAMYALTGIKLWDDSVVVAAAAGEDFHALYGAWMANNGLSAEGIDVVADKTYQTHLTYLKNGTYKSPSKPMTSTEKALLYLSMPRLQPFFHRGLKGVHLLTHGDAAFFAELDGFRRQYGFKVGFEWAPDLSTPRLREQLDDVVRRIDYFSISLVELSALYPEIRDAQDALAFLEALNCPTLFRMGTDGAYFICDHEAHFSPMVSAFGEQDPTGCGNTSTSAAFWAFCEGKPPLECSMIGAVTASLNAGTKGLMNFAREQREQCRELVQQLIR